MTRSNNQSKVALKSENTRMRVFQRAKISGQVIIHDEEHLYIAPIENISAAGVFIDQLEHFNEGSQVRMVVRSSHLNEPLQATGTVVRVQTGPKRGLAVEFTSISTRAREMIQNYVFESRLEATLKGVST